MNRLRPFLIALQFLTRIPIRLPGARDARARQSLPYYPLVGVIIGIVLFAAARLSAHADPALRAALVLAIWVGITGGLHLDGLADSADAWIGGHRNRDRTLAIMKDPYCGPAAVVSLVVVLLVKFAALMSLAADDARLVAIPTLARATMPLLFLTTPYVRAGGLGEALATNVPRNACVTIVALTAAAALGLMRATGLALLLVAAGIYFWWRRSMMSRIGGTTGDTAGALIEMTEATLLVTLALVSADVPIDWRASAW